MRSCRNPVSVLFDGLIPGGRPKIPTVAYCGLESGAWTGVDLTKAYIARIEESNPVLHAVTEINPDALAIAAMLDAERANAITRSALHGIPMLIKNNIATMDQMNNTAGSYSLIGAKMPRDATVASKLRAAATMADCRSQTAECRMQVIYR
ncbi:amidase-domain-containing protein [Acephala macrosclerotiorum]|nr:amidase-domain-containing protein [Acephala macrosclerotiorum]